MPPGRASGATSDGEISICGELVYVYQGRGRTLDYAWDFFCGRMIHRKLTSHPVRKQPFSSVGGKIKIDGDSFVQLVSKMAIFFHRR